MSKLRREGESWKYLKRGTVVHYLSDGIYGPRPVAECGASTLHSSDWRGTGTQEEYERVEALPECKKCLHKLGRA